ncbi:hypothetical protein ACOSQ4_022693 [Xanthoceras sorbifolium]
MISNIQRCTSKLSTFYKQKRKSLAIGLANKKKELRFLTSTIQEDGWPRIREVENDLDGLFQQEEEYWRQRSQVDWLRSGDKNTKFFHSKASGRRAMNRILGLQDSLGAWCDSPGGMERIVEDYFVNIFSSLCPSSADLDRVLGCVSRRLSPARSCFLDAPFMAEEGRVWIGYAELRIETRRSPISLSIFYLCRRFISVIF